MSTSEAWLLNIKYKQEALHQCPKSLSFSSGLTTGRNLETKGLLVRRNQRGPHAVHSSRLMMLYILSNMCYINPIEILNSFSTPACRITLQLIALA